MLSFIRLAAIALPLSLLASAGVSGSAVAQNAGGAGTQQPGFFERFFPSQTAAPAAAQRPVADTPSQAPTDGGSFNTNRGGLIDAMHGAQAQGCSGTLCDLFGGSSKASGTPSGTAAPAAPPRPVAVSSSLGSQAPADGGSFNDGRGGLIDAMRGVQVQGCGGTLCDLFGGSHDTPVAPPPGSAGPAPEATTSARPVRAARMGDDDEPVARKKPECTAPANDPWRCYRR